jgi:WhiB family transcriptional regulator, redox-sensing transcriptional regulator
MPNGTPHRETGGMDLSALITRGFAMSDRALWLLMVERGACSISELSPDDWYPVSASAEAARGEAAGAIAVCTACPVREECLELALRNWAVGQHGVWGGTVPVERERLRAARVAQLTRVLARNRGAGLAASRDADRAASLSPLRGDLMLGEPAFVGREDGRDEATSSRSIVRSAVTAAVGRAAAWSSATPSGILASGSIVAAGATAVRSAYEPCVRAMPKTRSPTRRPWSPAGTRSATPAKSMPRTNGYDESAFRRPRRLLSSGRLWSRIVSAAGIFRRGEVRIPWRHWSRGLRREASHGGQ